MSITSDRIRENDFIHPLLDDAADDIERLEAELAAEVEGHLGKEQVLIEQLAASQAREKVLRDRLVYVDSYLEERDENFVNLRGDIAIELSMSTDDTALQTLLLEQHNAVVEEHRKVSDEFLKAALAAERERCAIIAETPISGEQDDITMEAKDRVAKAIRELGDE